jgi:vacuolar-type H+-ATPase subunit I/STV1
MSLANEIVQNMYKNRGDTQNKAFTTPCSLKGDCKRKVCFFAHNREQLVKVPCHFDRRCNKRSECRRYHSDQTIDDYIHVNGWSFEEAKAVAEKTEEVLEKTEAVVEKIEEVAQVVEKTEEVEISDEVAEEYIEQLTKISALLQKERELLMERAALMQEIEMKNKMIHEKLQDINNQNELLDLIEVGQINESVSQELIEDFTFREYIEYIHTNMESECPYEAHEDFMDELVYREEEHERVCFAF